jgi:hypothetical protein
MHKISVLTFGSQNFNTSLEELKDYLNFKLTVINFDLRDIMSDNYDILFVHENYLKEKFSQKRLNDTGKIKILVTNTNIYDPNIFDEKILLPTSIKDINQIVEDVISKKNFNKNSSIKIKDYILDKNEKKLTKKNDFILLTEKEIQLLEMFLNNENSINKDKILNKVWKYASEADTHTVETHIYRLRKKIKDKFNDVNFILNNKSGYSL